MPHLFICTGEVSGDLQASHLTRALLSQRPDLQITAVGGERVLAAGAKLLHNTTAISSIGLLEALPFVGAALWAEWRIGRWLRRSRPDLVVLVDYIGVNSRVSALLQKLGIPAVYYIAPQEWVWQSSKLLTCQLAQRMQLMLAIFRQEARYYEAAGANVRWVGHPLIDILAGVPTRSQARAALGIGSEQILVVLVPASRDQELHLVAPALFAAARQLQQRLPQARFWVPLAARRFARPLARLAERHQLAVHFLDPGQHHSILAAADLVLAKSGTVNLETAILGIPQVVIYRLNPLTYWLGKQVLKLSVPFISPPNLVLMRPIVPELLQEQAQPQAIVAEAVALLTDPARQQRLRQDYAQMRQALGEAGVLQRAASEIVRVLEALKPRNGS